ENLDALSDIFSLGCVLYEMLTGRRPFSRDRPAETMASILREEPSGLSESSIPPALERIVRHCLEKRPERRFQSARDLAFVLTALSRAEEPGLRRSATSAERVTRSILPLPPGTRLSGQAAPVLAISRDGAKLAFVAISVTGLPHLYVSHLDRGETQQVPE